MFDDQGNRIDVLGRPVEEGRVVQPHQRLICQLLVPLQFKQDVVQ